MKITIATTIFLAAASFTMAQTTPQVGAVAPAVTLPSNDGRQVSLNDYKGKWVVLYFYPKDFTSGCTLEAQNFQRDLAKYQNASAIILGVSVDNAESHKQFCAKEGLNFKLLADTDTKVSEAYGSLKDYDGKKMSAQYFHHQPGRQNRKGIHRGKTANPQRGSAPSSGGIKEELTTARTRWRNCATNGHLCNEVSLIISICVSEIGRGR